MDPPRGPRRRAPAVKRSNGRGSIYFQKSRGLYAAAVDQGYVNGKRRRKIVFGKTVREVTEKLPHLQVAKQAGMLTVGKKQKLAEYLRWWISQRPANRTSRGYTQIIENHIAPTIGRITLDKLTATHIDGMLNALRGELSDTTRHHIRAVLSVALAYAERKSLVPRNVARLAEPISMPTYKGVYLDVAQANALLDAAKGHRVQALFTLAVYLGMRQGELLGLRWKDVDLERGTIRVFGQLQAEPGQPRGQTLVVNERPKWGSERTIGLPPETSLCSTPSARTGSDSGSNTSPPARAGLRPCRSRPSGASSSSTTTSSSQRRRDGRSPAPTSTRAPSARSAARRGSPSARASRRA